MGSRSVETRSSIVAISSPTTISFVQDVLAAVLGVIGVLNWGLVGLFQGLQWKANHQRWVGSGGPVPEEGYSGSMGSGEPFTGGVIER